MKSIQVDKEDATAVTGRLRSEHDQTMQERSIEDATALLKLLSLSVKDKADGNVFTAEALLKGLPIK
ncbi:hypothetical protein [Leclercia adecarboxylata]|uniref:hypothetical protein n=1 Tax=Leclercia adecarboxylata TaxID=83655 RepID=UPI00254D7C2F|nr:hypothetical protein [Leclercia adecarboxylata]